MSDLAGVVLIAEKVGQGGGGQSAAELWIAAEMRIAALKPRKTNKNQRNVKEKTRRKNNKIKPNRKKKRITIRYGVSPWRMNVLSKARQGSRRPPNVISGEAQQNCHRHEPDAPRFSKTKNKKNSDNSKKKSTKHKEKVKQNKNKNKRVPMSPQGE